MVDAWGSGTIMGTTAPETGHAVLQTVAVLTSDAGQREKVVLDCLYNCTTSISSISSTSSFSVWRFLSGGRFLVKHPPERILL